MPTGRRKCIFCQREDAKITREHVLPRWVRPLFPDLERVRHESNDLLPDGRVVQRHKHTAGTIDPVTNEPLVVVDQAGFLGDGDALPDNVAIGDGYLWAGAADEEGRGLRIDPATGDVARFEVEGGFAWPFLVEADRVWFGRDEIRLLDAETLEVVEVVDAEIEGIDAAFDPKTASLWVANYDGTITRIDLG